MVVVISEDSGDEGKCAVEVFWVNFVVAIFLKVERGDLSRVLENLRLRFGTQVADAELRRGPHAVGRDALAGPNVGHRLRRMAGGRDHGVDVVAVDARREAV